MRKFNYLFAITAMTFLLLIVLLQACHRKTAPTVADRTDIPPRPAPAIAASTASAADLEAGKQIYTVGKCAKCHDAKPVDKWTAEEWKPILKSMIPKAKLDSVQRMQVTAYVNLHARKG